MCSTGDFSIAEIGTDRYELLEEFDNIADTSGVNTPGHMNYNPFGDVFVDDAVQTPAKEKKQPSMAEQKQIAAAAFEATYKLLHEAALASKLGITIQDVRLLQTIYQYNEETGKLKPFGPGNIFGEFYKVLLSENAKATGPIAFWEAFIVVDVDVEKELGDRKKTVGEFQKILDSAGKGDLGVYYAQSMSSYRSSYSQEEITNLKKTELGQELIDYANGGIAKSIQDLLGEKFYNFIKDSRPIGAMQGSKTAGVEVHVLTYYSPEYKTLINVSIQVGATGTLKRLHTSLISGVELSEAAGIYIELKR